MHVCRKRRVGKLGLRYHLKKLNLSAIKKLDSQDVETASVKVRPMTFFFLEWSLEWSCDVPGERD